MNAERPIDTTITWDAGEAGCGRLIMGLKRQFKRMSPGDVIVVVARDPAAPIDLDYWCHMTGNRLEQATPPYFHLRKKDQLDERGEMS